MTLIDGSNVTIGHLGIVAGVFDTLEIGKYIDEVIPKTRHHTITHGTGVKALSLNGLGYNEGRLFLMPDFFGGFRITGINEEVTQTLTTAKNIKF